MLNEKKTHGNWGVRVLCYLVPLFVVGTFVVEEDLFRNLAFQSPLISKASPAPVNSKASPPLLETKEEPLSLHHSNSQEHLSQDAQQYTFKDCALKAKNGICVEDHLRALHLANKDKWPKIDIIIRSFHGRNMFLLQYLLRSIELFWPVGIAGDVILILDDTVEDRMEAFAMPRWVKILYEEVIPEIPGYAQQQYSMMLSDEHSKADFVAICDDDQVFHRFVTPDSIFGPSGKPYWIGNRSAERNFYMNNSDWYNGQGTYVANFIMALPSIFPRSMLEPMRKHFQAQHPDVGTFKELFLKADKVLGQLTGQTVMGNYAFNFKQDQIDFRLQDSDPPVPQIGAHVPAHPFFIKQKGDANPKVKKYEAAFVTSSVRFIKEATCNVFPPGELEGCGDVDVGSSEQFTVYDDMFVRFRNKEAGTRQMHEKFFCWAWSKYYQGAKVDAIMPQFTWGNNALNCTV